MSVAHSSAQNLNLAHSNQINKAIIVSLSCRAQREAQKGNAANDTAAPLAGHHKTIASVGGGTVGVRFLSFSLPDAARGGWPCPSNSNATITPSLDLNFRALLLVILLRNLFY